MLITCLYCDTFKTLALFPSSIIIYQGRMQDFSWGGGAQLGLGYTYICREARGGWVGDMPPQEKFLKSYNFVRFENYFQSLS